MENRLEILFENDFILVASKPAGLPCLPVKNKTEPTLSALLISQFPYLNKIGKENEAGLVHRIDNTTSGCVVLAKTEEAYEILRDIWNSDKVTKEYHALVLGKTPKNGIIETPIAHHATNKKKMRVCESKTLALKEKAREAHTEFERLETFSKEEKTFSHVKILITTGVRHQIRVHMASLGHPLMGDLLYQNMQKRKEDLVEIKRPLLHLYQASIKLPGEKIISVMCDYPEDFDIF